MRRARPVLLGLALAVAVVPSVLAVEPDDLPWEVQDYIENHKPGTIEDILEREGLRDPSETDITLPGQDQPDLVRQGERALDSDRLEPELPPVETRRELGDLQPAQVAAHPAGAEELKANVRPDTSAPPGRPVEPGPAAAPALEPARTNPGQHLAVRELAAPAPLTPRDGNDRTPAAASPPSVIKPRAPERTELAREPEPAAGQLQTTAAVTQPDPPLAVPSAPVTRPTVAVNGKLYLPLQYYFERKAAVTLKDFDEADRAALTEFYLKSAGETLWVGHDGFTQSAFDLIAEIKKADEWGLSSEDYKFPNLTKIGSGQFHEDDLADAEIKLTLVAMEYARHARGDRITNPPEQLSSYLDRKPQLVERSKLLTGLSAATDRAAFLRSLHPKHEQFERLREKLLALRSSGGESEIEPIPDGPKITPGKVHWQVRLVRDHLKTPKPAAKDDGTPFEDGYFDGALARAVIAYKEKHGMEPVNATITTALRRALNKQNRPLDERTLLANMEQWRWMPDDLGAAHVWVNIPEFLVRVKKDGQTIHEERIVTGKTETQTPVFSNRLRTVVFQPSWNVPESIKVNEFLPSLRSGNNPIERQGLVMQRNGRDIDAWDVDWYQQDIRNYHVYQPPGDSNVLGIVKFLFPNKHSVYLHDTPAKRLFNEEVRTFSHGCMRVRNPVRLAEVIMAEDKGWDKAQINELITNGPEDNDIALDKPMPVHVTYFTLWIGDDGQARTFGDIYGHEQRIKLGLEGRWNEIQKNRDHLAPADPGTIASSSEDWDEDTSRPVRRRGPQRYTYREEAPAYRVPPGYKQITPKKKGPSFSDFLNGVFGNN